MKILFKIINYYTQNFPFPFKGWKYMRYLLTKLNLVKRFYTKKIFTGAKLIVTPSDHIQHQIFWYGYYEKDAVCTWHSFMEKDSIVLDVGANIGFYSIVAVSKIVSGHVYAFEPVPRLINQFKENILINELSTITVVPFAVSDFVGKSPFYFSDCDNLGMSGFHHPDNYTGTNCLVETLILDEWANETKLSKLNMVKIDVEGAELNVLKGMEKLIIKFQPVIFIEILNRNLIKYGFSNSDVYELLYALNYIPYEIISQNNLRKVSNNKEADTIIFLPFGYRNPKEIIINEA